VPIVKSPDERDRERTAFLLALYELVEGIPGKRTAIDTVGAEIGLSKNESMIVYEWLHARGFVDCRVAAHRSLEITQAGVEVAEQVHRRGAPSEFGRLGGRGVLDDWGGPLDHWSSIETRLAGLRAEMDSARSLDDYQDVGRRGREVIIDAVNELFEDDMVPSHVEPLKGADAKKRFEVVIDVFAAGRAHAELRRLMRSAWDLSQKVTHGTEVTRVDAFAAAVLLVRTLGEMRSDGRPSN